MKNVLITGGNGFIGSNFLNYMVNKYSDVNFYNYDCNYYCASKKNTQNLNNKKNYKSYDNKLQSLDLLLSLFEIERIDTVIHFAAQSHVCNSFKNPLEFTNDNIIGTHTLLEAIRTSKENNKTSFNKLIYISTDEVYGDNDTFDRYDIKTESSKLNPTNPYAATKAAAEMLVNAYKHSYKLKTVITRCNNVYGPNQYPEKLIPKFIHLLLNNKKCTIHGDGTSLRSFIHVYDVCTAMDVIIHKGLINETYNIGSRTEDELSVNEIAKLLINKLKPTENINNWLEYVNDRPYNDKRYFITNDKLKKLGWDITINIETGISSLI